MKTTQYLLLLTLGSFTLFSTSCQQDDPVIEVETLVSETSSIDDLSLKNVDQDLDDFAFILSGSLNDKEIKRAIKEEALKQFDGDYDVLYKSLRNKNLLNGEKFNQRLARMSNNARTTGRSVEEIADSIAALYPNLQVSIPVHIENFDPDTQTPLIAICPYGILESEVETIKAYDDKGNVHWLDAKVDPTVAVIVVGISERVDQDGNLLETFEKTLTSSNGRVRNDGFSEKLFQAYCYDLNTYEGWVHGAPELRLVISTGKVPNIVDETYHIGVRNDIKNSWWTADGRLLFNWYRADYSDVAVFHWFEWDGNGSTKKLTGSVSYRDETTGITSSTGYEITYVAGDFELGKKVVNFKDDSGQEYNIGWIKWKGYN